MVRLSFLSRRSHSISYAEQMRLCLFCLWLLQAMLLAKKQAHTKPELSATLEAPHSADIKALAAQLDNNPYCIHQWVHDYIRFFPTYGSVQGAQETLAKKSGNAFDTASLLIALLRSASIESRYVYGTVDIPAEQLMNWVGDAKTPDAAQQILGQGGIPNTALTRGGKVAFAWRIPTRRWQNCLLVAAWGRRSGMRFRLGKK
jgi:hypothetical protein